jgi:hypothetical protein
MVFVGTTQHAAYLTTGLIEMAKYHFEKDIIDV